MGDHNKNFICRQCLSSYTTENTLKLNKQKCRKDEITTLRTSPESHFNWKNHFYKNPLCFRIYADFEADNEKHNSSTRNKTTNILKQNPVHTGYQKKSELDDVLKSGYYQSQLGFDNLEWFVNDVIKIKREIKMAVYIKNTQKDITMTEEDEAILKNIDVCRFCEKEIVSD